MPESAPLPLPINRDSLGRTARAGLWILGIGLALQLGAIAYHYAVVPPLEGDGLAGSPNVTGPTPKPNVTPGGFVLPPGSQPPLEDAAPAVPKEELPPRPAPITERTFMGNAPPLVTALLDQARELRFRGDLANALVKLREARLIEPRNAFVMAEIASTYEKMENLPQAQAYWRELRAMGDAAGVLRELADYKLGRGTTQPSGLTNGPDFTAPTGANRDASGLPPEAVMGFADLAQEQNKDADGHPFLTVRLTVKARPKPAVEPRDVFVLVYFYETVEGQYIVQTNADVSYHWRSRPADWAEDKNTEVLEVDYRQPGALPGDDLPADKAEGLEIRKYYGYIARIYYKGDLQDAAAEPASLLSQFPPPATLPLE
jgi:hypothetical protein